MGAEVRAQRLLEAFPITPGKNSLESIHDHEQDLIEIRLNGRAILRATDRQSFRPELLGGTFVALAEEYEPFTTALSLMEMLTRHARRNGGWLERTHSRGFYNDSMRVLRDDERYYVYICQGCRGALYTGISTNPARRIREHNTLKRGAKWARSQRPVKLLWFDHQPLTKSRALKFERRLKTLTRSQKLCFVRGDLPIEIPE